MISSTAHPILTQCFLPVSDIAFILSGNNDKIVRNSKTLMSENFQVIKCFSYTKISAGVFGPSDSDLILTETSCLKMTSRLYFPNVVIYLAGIPTISKKVIANHCMYQTHGKREVEFS